MERFAIERRWEEKAVDVLDGENVGAKRGMTVARGGGRVGEGREVQVVVATPFARAGERRDLKTFPTPPEQAESALAPDPDPGLVPFPVPVPVRARAAPPASSPTPSPAQCRPSARP